MISVFLPLEYERYAQIIDSVVRVVRRSGLQIGVPEFELAERNQIDSRQIDAQLVDMRLGEDAFRQRIADFGIFQAQIVAADHPEGREAVVVLVCTDSQARILRVGVLGRPVVAPKVGVDVGVARLARTERLCLLGVGERSSFLKLRRKLDGS